MKAGQIEREELIGMKGRLPRSSKKELGSAWKTLLLLAIIGSNTVQSNTLIESFALPRSPDEALEITRFLLVKHSDSNEAFFQPDKGRNSAEEDGWESRLRAILTMQYGAGKEHEEHRVESPGVQGEPGQETTEIATIRPNAVSRLRLRLSRTSLPQNYSYLFLVDQARSRRSSTDHEARTEEKLFDSFSHAIDRSATALLRFFGAPPSQHQRFSVRFSWDASDHLDLHLDLDHSPSSLSDLRATLSNISFFNLTVTPNFDKFSGNSSGQTHSFVDLLLIIEPLLLNALPMFTLLPLITTSFCILSVAYFAGLPSKFENFVKNFSQ